MNRQKTRKAIRPSPCARGHSSPWPPGQRSEETRLNSSHVRISYAVFCLKKKKKYQFERTNLPGIRSLIIPIPFHSLLYFSTATLQHSPLCVPLTLLLLQPVTFNQLPLYFC